MPKAKAWLQCIEEKCSKEYSVKDKRYKCDCGGLLDVRYDFSKLKADKLRKKFDKRLSSKKNIDRSGVWRFRELIPFYGKEENIVTMPEGNTNIFSAPKCTEYAGMKETLLLKHQGMNPTGSFKDNGMTTGVTMAKRLKARIVACASTGNTSASLAAYAARAGIDCVVFVPDKQIAFGKLSQALDYGAKTLQIRGDFDDAMRLVYELSQETDIYLLNSVNPFRLEGQKTIMFEMLQQLDWNVPDRIVVPGGNLGNSSSFGKAFSELKEIGLIEKPPMITIVQAQGSNPLYRTLASNSPNLITVDAHTLATAIKIGNPVSWKKAVRAMDFTSGWCDQVSEQEIANAKAIIGSEGIGCEPASATTLAGIKKLINTKEIKPEERIVAILTGNLLKDPDYTVRYHQDELYEKAVYKNIAEKAEGKISAEYANKPIKVDANKKSIREALGI